MIKRFGVALVLFFLLSSGAMAETAMLKIANTSAMDIVYNNTNIVSGSMPVSIEIEMPDLEENLGYLCFSFNIGDEAKTACLTTARAPEAFWQALQIKKALTLSFYTENDATYAALAIGPSLKAAPTLRYRYSEILQDWGIIEEAYGIIVYQDEKADWEAWKAATESGAEWRTAWEHLYPGEMTDWLRSPMESRAFIVPVSEIYSVSTWGHDDVGSFKLERLTHAWPKVDSSQMLVVKTFGDFGWGMLTYQNAAQEWFFMEYGYDGWGAYGDMWYKINTTLSDYITPAPNDVPWQTAE